MITVSLLGWLDLPAFSLVEWFQGQPLIARLPAGVIREYMKVYAKEMGIMENLRPYTRVTEVLVSFIHKLFSFFCSMSALHYAIPLILEITLP